MNSAHDRDGAKTDPVPAGSKRLCSAGTCLKLSDDFAHSHLAVLEFHGHNPTSIAVVCYEQIIAACLVLPYERIRSIEIDDYVWLWSILQRHGATILVALLYETLLGHQSTGGIHQPRHSTSPILSEILTQSLYVAAETLSKVDE